MMKSWLVIGLISIVVLGSFPSASIGYGPDANWGPGYGPGGMMGGGMMGGGMKGGGMMGGGMMSGNSMMPYQGYNNYTQGWGMMGQGMMGGMPMMKGMMGYYSQVPIALSHENAEAIASNYLASMNNLGLTIDEFEEYSHNFYVSIIEKSTGRGAIEIIIDRYSGDLQPEPPSMMWNRKYGMMSTSQEAEMAITSERALKIAQDFLDAVYPGTEADEIVAYYGYYTIMTTLNNEHYGM